MRFSTILFSAALAYKAANSMAVDYDLLRREATTIDSVENKDFKITYYCIEDYNNKCSSYKNYLKESIDILSETFEFYKPISIEAFVDDSEIYAACSIGGFADDINYIALKSSNNTNATPYVYSQALAKQLNLNVEPKYKEYDFSILLNTFKCFERLEKKENKKPVDFFSKAGYTRTITHEIIHGMGFIATNFLHEFNITSEVPYGDLKSTNITEKSSRDKISLAPLPIIDYNTDILSTAKDIDDLNKGIFSSPIKGFYPLSIFEKYIVDINTKEKIFENLGSLYKEVQDKCLPNGSVFYSELIEKNMFECYQNLSDETKLSLASITDHYLKTKSIGILTKNGNVEPLQTFDNFYTFGSSVVHPDFKKYPDLLSYLYTDEELVIKYLNADFYNDTYVQQFIDGEYVMYFGIDDNISIDMYKRNIKNKHGLIGQGIVEILKTLGWTEKGEQRSNDLYYVDESIVFPTTEVIRDIAFARQRDPSSISLDTPDIDPSPVETEVPTETQVPIGTSTVVEIETQVPAGTSTVVEIETPTPSIDDNDSMDEVEVKDSDIEKVNEDSDSDEDEN